MPIKKGITKPLETLDPYPTKDDVLAACFKLIKEWREMWLTMQAERDLLWFKLYGGDNCSSSDIVKLFPGGKTLKELLPDPEWEPEIGAPYRPTEE